MTIPLRQIVTYLALWSIIGIAAFNVFVIVVFRTGIVWAARTRDGKLKKRIPWAGIFAMLSILGGIVGLQTAANYFGLASWGIPLSFGQLFLLNFGHYLILLAYDTFVIDYLVLSRWRPAFLLIPDEMNTESMREHIIASLPIGTIIGAVLTAISTAITYFMLLRG